MKMIKTRLNPKRLIASVIAPGFLMLAGCSADVPEPTVYPEAGSPSAQLYQAKCGACHGAPDPAVHIDRVWASVLQRMQMRMKAKGITPLDKNELSEILDYLQRHAGNRKNHD